MSIMDPEEAIAVARRHRDAAASPGLAAYWEAVAKSIEKKTRSD